MTQNPKRIPGERNPEIDPSRARLIQEAHNASAGAGSGDLGLRAALDAWSRWRQRRRVRKAIAADEQSKREQ